MKPFRRYWAAFAAIGCLFVALTFAAARLPALVEWKLRSVLGADTTFEGKVLPSRAWKEISFESVVIQNPRMEFTARRAALRYTPAGLARKRLSLLAIEDAKLRVTGDPNLIRAANAPGASVAGGAALDRLEIKNLRFELATKSLSAAGSLSVTADLAGKKILQLDALMPSAAIGEIQLSGFSAQYADGGPGRLSVQKTSYQKWQMSRMQASFTLDGAVMSARLEEADWLGTPVTGEASADFGAGPHYRVLLRTDSLPLPQILETLEWDKKVSIGGALGGTLEAEGVAGKLTKLSGVWAWRSGGELVILDQALLERLAASSKQPLSIIKASFEKYHYNTGQIAVSSEREDIRLRIGLEGESGKRDLEVNLHDLF